MEVTKGNDAELLCTSGGVPLQYCRFISPQGIPYHLENETTDTGYFSPQILCKTHSLHNFFRISYTGQGLLKGECGVNISNVNTTHEGNWTCVTRLGYNNFKQNEISAVIQLAISDTSSSIGVISFFLTISFLFYSIILFCSNCCSNWKRRRCFISYFRFCWI